MIATKPATTFLPLLSGETGQEGTHTLPSAQPMPTHLPPLAIPSVPRGRGAGTEESSWGIHWNSLESTSTLPCCLLQLLAGLLLLPPATSVLYQKGFSKGAKGEGETKSVLARQGNWESLRLDPRKATEGQPGRMWNSLSKICAR